MAATSLPYHADRLRCYEAVHRLAPRLFRCGAVRTPAVLPLNQGDNSRRLVLDEATELVGLTWRSDVSEGPASALGLYRDKNGRITWVPFVWRGLHAGDTEDAKSLRVFLSGYDRRPGFRYGLAPASPIGVVFVVIDRLAGLRVRLQFPHLPMAIVTADGELFHQLDPVPPVGTVVDAGEYTSSVGYPEKALARLSSDTVFIALQGTTERGVFELVNQYPGSPMADLAQGVGHPQSRIRAIVGAFDSAELMEVLDARPYLAKPGRNKAAHRDRMHANVIHRRFGIYTDPSSTYRLQQRNHDADAGRLVAHCSTADISHGAGWRLEIISSNGTQLRPDLYVLIPRGTDMECGTHSNWNDPPSVPAQLHSSLTPPGLQETRESRGPTYGPPGRAAGGLERRTMTARPLAGSWRSEATWTNWLFPLRRFNGTGCLSPSPPGYTAAAQSLLPT